MRQRKCKQKTSKAAKAILAKELGDPQNQAYATYYYYHSSTNTHYQFSQSLWVHFGEAWIKSLECQTRTWESVDTTYHSHYETSSAFKWTKLDINIEYLAFLPITTTHTPVACYNNDPKRSSSMYNMMVQTYKSNWHSTEQCCWHFDSMVFKCFPAQSSLILWWLNRP